MQHQNIIKVFDIKQVEDVLWIFMEYCDYGDLDNYCKTFFSQLVDSSKVRIMIQMIEGVAFLHSHGITHRDIKPGNILITKGPDGGTVRLTDFGISAFLDPTGIAIMSTTIGTEVYMAPEFWERDMRGRISYDNSVDIYAAGLTFLALIQATRGRPLLPMIENVMDRTAAHRLGLAIGHAMLNKKVRREPELRLVKIYATDSQIIRNVKILIRQMTCVFPNNRPAAFQVKGEMQKAITGLPQINRTNPLIGSNSYQEPVGQTYRSLPTGLQQARVTRLPQVRSLSNRTHPPLVRPIRMASVGPMLPPIGRPRVIPRVRPMHLPQVTPIFRERPMVHSMMMQQQMHAAHRRHIHLNLQQARQAAIRRERLTMYYGRSRQYRGNFQSGLRSLYRRDFDQGRHSGYDEESQYEVRWTKRDALHTHALL